MLTNEKEPEKTQVSVTKVWEDQENAAEKRPESISVTLLADGEAVGTATLNPGNGWSYTWKDLPKNHNESGLTGEQKKIVYLVSETEIPENYESELSGDAKNGFVLTNTYKKTGKLVITKQFLFDEKEVEPTEKPTPTPTPTPVPTPIPMEEPTPTPEPEIPQTSASVFKVWEDNNNAAGLRPASVRMILSDGQSVLLSEGNGWSATIYNLPAEKADGSPIHYTWHEESVMDYVLTDVAQNGNNAVFTNALWHRPELADEVEKPKVPGDILYVFDEYETPLGVEVMINHVGDCFD